MTPGRRSDLKHPPVPSTHSCPDSFRQQPQENEGSVVKLGKIRKKYQGFARFASVSQHKARTVIAFEAPVASRCPRFARKNRGSAQFFDTGFKNEKMWGEVGEALHSVVSRGVGGEWLSFRPSLGSHPASLASIAPRVSA